MKRNPFLAVARVFCLPAAILLVSGIAAAESVVSSSDTNPTLYQYGQTAGETQTTIKGTGIETSAECEARVAAANADAQAGESKAAGVMAVGEDCRTSCKKIEAGDGQQWIGTAPSCSMKNAKQGCKDLGGTVVDWSYCGDGKYCVTGKKILCQLPSADHYTSLAAEASTVVWYGTPPACNSNRGKQQCKDAGGTVELVTKCGDGAKCCMTGQLVKCKIPNQFQTAPSEEAAPVDANVTWFGKPPACNANKASQDCREAGGTVALESKCSDGASGQKVDCCTTGKMVACVLPQVTVVDTQGVTATPGETVTADVQWLGKPPACNADRQENECKNLGGTVEKKDKCTDGTDGKKKTCCTTGKMVKCIVPRITGG
jgi:hypothetical protein